MAAESQDADPAAAAVVDTATSDRQARAEVKKRRQRLWAFARTPLIVVALLALALGTLMLFEESLIFIPSKYPDGFWQPEDPRIEDAYFAAADGTALHGWYLPHPQPRAVVLIAHGNAGNVTDRADLLIDLNKQVGVTAMVFDYRGYGRSAGSPNEAGVVMDARAAREWLAKKAGCAESEIILMGESIGCGVVVELAASDGCRALILDSAYPSLPDIAAIHFPWVPVRLLMRTRFNAASRIREYRGPLLQVHRADDTIIPLALGQQFYAAAGEPKEHLLLLPGDHNDPRPQAFYDAVRKLVERL